jgi:hypothetical protein
MAVDEDPAAAGGRVMAGMVTRGLGCVGVDGMALPCTYSRRDDAMGRILVSGGGANPRSRKSGEEPKLLAVSLVRVGQATCRCNVP